MSGVISEMISSVFSRFTSVPFRYVSSTRVESAMECGIPLVIQVCMPEEIDCNADSQLYEANEKCNAAASEHEYDVAEYTDCRYEYDNRIPIEGVVPSLLIHLPPLLYRN